MFDENGGQFDINNEVGARVELDKKYDCCESCIWRRYNLFDQEDYSQSNDVLHYPHINISTGNIQRYLTVVAFDLASHSGINTESCVNPFNSGLFV